MHGAGSLPSATVVAWRAEMPRVWWDAFLVVGTYLCWLKDGMLGRGKEKTRPRL